jgi:hypothetical protein
VSEILLTELQKQLCRDITAQANLALVDRGDLLLIADAPLDDRVAVAEYLWGPGEAEFLKVVQR